ncbi:hypothetical protein B566_EDAN000890 [Ephemera danica]|nr:hypothetical protein B566_EDAN000890 [Ephemera danica]
MANELKGCKGELHAAKCDISNEEDVVRVVKWARENLGGADVLVNNAGVAPPCELSSFSTKDVQSILNTNIFGLCLFTREVIKDMRDRGVDDGHIFHINSTSGQRICAEPTGLYVYAGSKHAIRSVSPGLVRSEIFGDGELAEQMFTENPTLEPRDIADALVYALSTPPHVQVCPVL